MKKIILIFLFSSVLSAQTAVQFDHVWNGAVELQLRSLLSSGLAGADGSNGQAIINAMNALGGIYVGGEFQAHHDGPAGFPTYGFGWFYVSYITTTTPAFYQIIEFGTPPAADSTPNIPTPTNPTPPPLASCPDYTSLIQAISDQNERIFADSTNQRNANTASLSSQIQVLTTVVNSPSWLGKVGSFLSSPQAMIVETALGTFLTCKTSGKC